jgi:hypothetical protein
MEDSMAYKQAVNRKKRLQKTYNEVKNMRGHYTAAGVWIDEDRGFFYRYRPSNTPGYAKLIRRISNKKVRKSKESFKYADYRRLYDYKWTML